MWRFVAFQQKNRICSGRVRECCYVAAFLGDKKWKEHNFTECNHLSHVKIFYPPLAALCDGSPNKSKELHLLLGISCAHLMSFLLIPSPLIWIWNRQIRNALAHAFQWLERTPGLRVLAKLQQPIIRIKSHKCVETSTQFDGLFWRWFRGTKLIRK